MASTPPPRNTTPPNIEQPKTNVTPSRPHYTTKYSLKPFVPSSQKRVEVAYETRGRYYGPMPEEMFLEKFMQYEDTTIERTPPTNYRLQLMRSVASMKTEVEMYPAFVKALNRWPPADEGRKIRLAYKDSHSYGDPNCAGLSVDIGVADTKTPLWRKDKQILFAEQETHVEFKLQSTSDPFDDRGTAGKNVEGEEATEEQVVVAQQEDLLTDGDETAEQLEEEEVEGEEPEDDDIPKGSPDLEYDYRSAEPEDDKMIRTERSMYSDWKDHPFENSTDAGVSCRGQIAYYAAATMTVQYRSHFFQLVIFGRYARFIRWERSSAIVTRRFNYYDRPEMIFDFYRRLAQLNRTARGHDPEITRANKKDAGLARKAFRTFFTDGWHGRSEWPQKSEQRDIDTQAFLTLVKKSKETVDGVEKSVEQKFVICAPIFYSDCYTPFGRSGRRSLAYEIDNKRICFMKDFYSQDYESTLKESEVYRRIQEQRNGNAQVPRGLCTMIVGGDVEGTKTLGHEYWKESWVHKDVFEPPELIAHRILLKEVGASVRTFTNCKTMLTCAADAMEAHSWLLHELHILHRDISPGNIIMERQSEKPGIHVRRGWLIDFDHAVDLKRLRPSQSPRRSGTPQFFSCFLIESPKGPHTQRDDRESCFYSIVYLSMLHLRHSLSDKPAKLHERLQSCFEQVGDGKYAGLVRNRFSGLIWENTGLRDVLKALEDVFKWRYMESSLMPKASEFPQWQRAQMEILDDKDWMHKTIREHVETMPDPPEREFVINKHSDPVSTTSKKRASETLDTYNRRGLDGHLNVDTPPLKKPRNDD